MTRPTPADARKAIADNIGRSAIEALGLKESLEAERSALEAQDADALQEIVVRKTAFAEKLQALDLQRSALCHSLGFSAGHAQMDEIIEWCDEDGLIDQGWSQLMLLAADGNQLNLTNGAIIRLRQQQFETSISLLRGVNPGSDTYGRHGVDSGDHGRRSLAEA